MPPALRHLRSVSALLLVLFASACAGEHGEAAAQSAPPPVTAFNAFGMPGPWWRAGASAEEFDLDLRTCRSESSAARARPGEADPLDAAYRSFLGCMERLAWTRGRPPS